MRHIRRPSYLADQRGLTGAERALLICVGLAILVSVSLLVRKGGDRAAGDAERTLRTGTGNVGSLPATAALSGTQMIRAVAALVAPAPMVAPAPVSEAGTPAEPGPVVAPAAPAAPTFTAKVYERNRTLTGRAQIAIPDAAMRADLARFQANWQRNHARYQTVSAQTGIPAKLIAALHWRESSGNFNTYLHQGDPLGRPARNVPRNIPVFHVWEDAAVHALNMKGRIQRDLGITANTTDRAAIATYAEYYNGLGYYNRGRVSPYVYSGTDQYQRGKYVRDGVYDPNVRDRQMGVILMIDSLPDLPAQPQPPQVQPPPPPNAGAPMPRRHFLRRRSAASSARR